MCATILARRGRGNLRHLSRSCDDGERTLARQCRRCVAGPDFHPRGIPVALDPRSAGNSAQDASFLPQSGKQTGGRGHCCNGCPSRAARGLASSPLAVVEVTHRCACTLAVAQPPQAMTRRSRSRRRKRPEGLLTGSHCVRSVIASRRRSPVMAWTGTLQRSHTWMTRSVSTGTRFPSCAAAGWLPSTGPHPKRCGTRRNYDGQVHLQARRRFEALGTLAAHRPL